MSQQSRLVRIKVVLLGDGAVGKTSIARRYLGHGFIHQYKATIGVDFYIKKTELVLNGYKYMIEWSIWDLAGQPHWKEVRPGFYVGAQGALIVFDISRRQTLQNVIEWANEFMRNSGSKGPILLIGNKIDLRESCKDCITPEEGKLMAKKLSEIFGYPVQYIETSAKTGENINQAFEELGKTILRRILEQVKKKAKQG